MPASNSRSTQRSTSERASSAEAGNTPAPIISASRSGWQAAWSFLRGPYPTLLSRAVVGLVFLLAGVSKGLDMHAFAAEISAYQMAPSALIQPMAIALPLLEILIAVYLLVGLAQRWTAAAASVLLLIFISAMASALARGLTLDCGCFGNALGLSALRETVSAGSIARDALWLALCVHLFFVPGIWSIDAWRQKRAASLSGE
jgi:uncharacterized membrane protein YphA (DoxX/SURF4 family)